MKRIALILIMAAMVADGLTEVVEVGPGKVLQGLFGRTYRDLQVTGIQ